MALLVVIVDEAFTPLLYDCVVVHFAFSIEVLLLRIHSIELSAEDGFTAFQYIFHHPSTLLPTFPSPSNSTHHHARAHYRGNNPHQLPPPPGPPPNHHLPQNIHLPLPARTSIIASDQSSLSRSPAPASAPGRYDCAQHQHGVEKRQRREERGGQGKEDGGKGGAG